MTRVVESKVSQEKNNDQKTSEKRNLIDEVGHTVQPQSLKKQFRMYQVVDMFYVLVIVR